MSEESLPMLQGKFAELDQMSIQDMHTEIEAWRNLWSYTPSEVKYYLLKSGSTVAITMRNYRRHIGVLLTTRWDIREMEMGVYEKEYDQSEGRYYYERKIIKLNPQGIIDLQWISERIPEEEIEKQIQQSIEEEEKREKKEQGE